MKVGADLKGSEFHSELTWSCKYDCHHSANGISLCHITRTRTHQHPEIELFSSITRQFPSDSSGLLPDEIRI
jgi:hypothetical protein